MARRVSCGLLAILILACVAGCARPAVNAAQDEAALLALHKATLKAHLDGDVEAFLDPWADELLMVNRGTMEAVARDDSRQNFAEYFGSVQFEYYRDRKPPRIEVSRDGTMGWVAAEVEAKGVRMTSEGEAAPLAFQSAWVSLYRKVDGEWRLAGNASSFAQ